MTDRSQLLAPEDAVARRFRHFGRTRMVRLDRPLWRRLLTFPAGCCHHFTHDQADCDGTWQRDWSGLR